MNSGIRAIVLAAGESSRMGTNKLLLPYKGKTIITVLINNIIQSEINGITVVLGAFRKEIEAELSGLPVTTCFNRDYTKGMLSSVQCGFLNLPENTDAAMVFQGDQPLITTSVINRIISEYRSAGKGIAIPVYQGKRGHPVIINTKYSMAINHLNPGLTLRDLIHRNLQDVVEVDLQDPGILKDVDTRDDYQQIIK
jgi:molybdenum cofactor cytidylyltransferase